MSDEKSGRPPPPSTPLSGPPLAVPASGVPVAPPRSVPPAVTPQRIPSPAGQSVPAPRSAPTSSVPPRPASPLPPRPPVSPLPPPVDLDVVDPDALAHDEPEEPSVDEVTVPQPAVAARRDVELDADWDPADERETLVQGAPLEPLRTTRRLAIESQRGEPLPEERLPSFDDPEHPDDHLAPERLSESDLEVTPLFRSDPALRRDPSSVADPDSVDTPIPAAPVQASAPPAFVPPASPLLPDLTSGLPPAAVPHFTPPPPPSPPLGPSSSAPAPPKRLSRPPVVMPDAVVAGIQPAAYQGSEDELSLSEADLELSTSEQPPEVVSSPMAAEAPAASNPAFASPEPAPETAASGSAAPTSADAKKPPPPKRSAKPVLPSAAVRRRPWWETLFGDDFARAHRSPTPPQLARDVQFISTTLGLTRSQIVLDLGCGQGEHAVELCRRGIPVVGYDLSVFQLAMAGDRAQQEGQKINFLQGDMREMAFDSMFDAVICWDTTFGYFEEDKNLDVARRILAALKPGGSLLLHVMNRDFAARESPSNIWFEGDGCVCMDEVDFDWITSRLRVKRSLILDDGRSKELHYSVRLYNLSEIGKLLHEVGFRVAAVSGDVSTPGAFFGPASPYIIIRAQKP